MLRRNRRFTVLALGLGMLATAGSAAAEDDPVNIKITQKPWTQGTTQAANEVVGARSGLGFSFTPPPIPDSPDPSELTLSAEVVVGLVQTLEFIPPPIPDLPPGPIAVRIRLLPPGPIAPARLEVQVLDESALSLLGPNGQPATLCGGTSTGGQ